MSTGIEQPVLHAGLAIRNSEMEPVRDETDHPGAEQVVHQTENDPQASASILSSSQTATVNGQNRVASQQADDSDPYNDEELTPPPDTPLLDNLSAHSSMKDGNTPEDEFVVNSNRLQSSPLRVTLNAEDDVAVDDAHDVDEDEDEEDEEPMDDDTEQSIFDLRKRKRASHANDGDASEISYGTPATRKTEAVLRRPKQVKVRQSHGTANVKSITLGVWRLSDVEDPVDKHVVVGFLDIKDRLRTRVHPLTRDGKDLRQTHPLPPGPGASWVTWDKVAFDEHLVNLDHEQVKEYIRVRSETMTEDETREERTRRNLEAVQEAIRRSETHPYPEPAGPIQIAYGLNIPEHARPNQHDPKRRKTNESVTLTPVVPTRTHQEPLLPLQQLESSTFRGSPARIMIGFWKKSNAPADEDKHAVLGVLGLNNMFRVKLAKETRDGRPAMGNFPPGPGGLWIAWEDVEFEPHLRNFNRPQLKEYCRIRQDQLEAGEQALERQRNELDAAQQARQRVFASGGAFDQQDEVPAYPMPPAPDPPKRNGGFPLNAAFILNNEPEPMEDDTHAANGQGNLHRDTPQRKTPAFADARLSLPESGRHALPDSARHSRPEASLRSAHQPPHADVQERHSSAANREITRIEAQQQRVEQRAFAREADSSGNPNNHASFLDHRDRLNRVWASQELQRLKSGDEDAKIYMGVKYERKAGGPFQGKLVSSGTIISIDGEDYVEYRVLTKPTFF